MGSPESASIAIRNPRINNNMNEEQRFRGSKRFKNAMKKLSNVSGGKDGYESYIPSRVIYKYTFEGVSLNQAINDIEKKIKYYKNMNTIFNHTEKMKGNEFNKFIFNRLNRGIINYNIAEKLGRERLKRAKAKEPKSPSRIEKRKRYENELKNMSRSEAKNKLERLFRGHKIDFRTYEYLNRIIEKPRIFKHKRKSISSMEKLASVVNKELKKNKK